MEIVQIIRNGDSQSKGIRQFTSGMVGIAKDQIVRVNAVNTASSSSEEEVEPTICFGVWQNPSSELLAQSKIPLKPGASAFLDVDFDTIKGDEKTRHQVRAVVTIINDTYSSCQVSLEVFDKHSGKTAVFMDVHAVKTTMGPKG